MTWTALSDRTTGTLVTAAMWNQAVGVTGDLAETAAAKVTTAGDMVYATGPNALARLGIGATANAVLQVVGGVPAWVASPVLNGAEPTTDVGADLGSGVKRFRDVFVGGNIKIGGTVASDGAIRVGNDNYVKFRNAADSGDVVALGLTNANVVQVGQAGTGVRVDGYLGVGTAPSATVGIAMGGAVSAGASANATGVGAVNGTLAKTASGGELHGIESSLFLSVPAGITCDRATQFYGGTIAATVGGTLTNHNIAYFGVPVNGTTVRVIDTGSGAYLTTGGVWTNNPSWAALKEGVRRVGDEEVRGWLDWLRDDYRPVRYRYRFDRTEAGPDGRPRTVTVRDQSYEYDHLGFLLDDMPAHVREIVCADPAGGISTKDTEGFLLALVKGLALEVAELRARVTG